MVIVNKENRICVIGSGVAGVATAKALSAYGLEFVVYERNSGVGGLWYKNYPGARVQTNPDLYEFPGKKYPERIRNRSDPPCPTAKEVCTYLEEYIQEHGISDRFEFGVSIKLVSKEADGSWVVESSKGTEIFGFVIVCTGLVSDEPYMINIPGMDDFQKAGGKIIHTSEWKSLSDLAGKKVLVIGNGKSAADVSMAAAHIAADSGSAPPVQAIRRKHWYMPRYLVGLVQYKWAFHCRFGSALLPRYFESQSLLAKIVHGVTTPLKWVIWRAIELVLLAQLRLPMHLWPRMGTMETEAAFGFSTIVTDEKHLALLRERKIDMRIATVDKFEPGKATLSTGNVIDVDMVVMGTGWKLGYSFLDEKTVRSKLDIEDDGLWLYRNILPAQLPGIAFVGANTLTFMNIYTSYIQAFWLAGLLAERRGWPTNEKMADVVQREQIFKRRLYPECALRGASVEAYTNHYHDVLLKEQGIDPKVYKGYCGTIANMFMPMLPETMAGVLEPACNMEDV